MVNGEWRVVFEKGRDDGQIACSARAEGRGRITVALADGM